MLKLRGLRQCTLLMLVATGAGAPSTGHAESFPSNYHPHRRPDPGGHAPDIHQSCRCSRACEAERWAHADREPARCAADHRNVGGSEAAG